MDFLDLNNNNEEEKNLDVVNSLETIDNLKENNLVQLQLNFEENLEEQKQEVEPIIQLENIVPQEEKKEEVQEIIAYETETEDTEVLDGTAMDHNTVETVEGIIDRFEGDYIVVEIEGKMYDVLRSITDEELAEGDVLDVVIQEGEVVSITKNPEKTKTAEDALADLLKDMWK